MSLFGKSFPQQYKQERYDLKLLKQEVKKEIKKISTHHNKMLDKVDENSELIKKIEHDYQVSRKRLEAIEKLMNNINDAIDGKKPLSPEVLVLFERIMDYKEELT